MGARTTPKKGIRPPGWEEIFFSSLTATANVEASARAARVDRRTVYKHRKSDPAFAERWNEALRSGMDDLIAEVVKRAKEKSDLLAIFLLKSYMPEVFNRELMQKIPGSAPDAPHYVVTLPERCKTIEEWTARRAVKDVNSPDAPPD